MPTGKSKPKPKGKRSVVIDYNKGSVTLQSERVKRVVAIAQNTKQAVSDFGEKINVPKRVGRAVVQKKNDVVDATTKVINKIILKEQREKIAQAVSDRKKAFKEGFLNRFSPWRMMDRLRDKLKQDFAFVINQELENPSGVVKQSFAAQATLITDVSKNVKSIQKDTTEIKKLLKQSFKEIQTKLDAMGSGGGSGFFNNSSLWKYLVGAGLATSIGAVRKLTKSVARTAIKAIKPLAKGATSVAKTVVREGKPVAKYAGRVGAQAARAGAKGTATVAKTLIKRGKPIAQYAGRAGVDAARSAGKGVGYLGKSITKFAGDPKLVDMVKSTADRFRSARLPKLSYKIPDEALKYAEYMKYTKLSTGSKALYEAAKSKASDLLAKVDISKIGTSSIKGLTRAGDEVAGNPVVLRFLKNLKAFGSKIALAGPVVAVLLDAIDPAVAIWEGKSEKEIEKELAGMIGSIAGTMLGATIGGMIGAWFFGVGAVPGAFIGAIGGSLGGEALGELFYNMVMGRIAPNNESLLKYLMGVPEWKSRMDQEDFTRLDKEYQERKRKIQEAQKSKIVPRDSSVKGFGRFRQQGTISSFGGSDYTPSNVDSMSGDDDLVGGEANDRFNAPKLNSPKSIQARKTQARSSRMEMVRRQMEEKAATNTILPVAPIEDKTPTQKALEWYKNRVGGIDSAYGTYLSDQSNQMPSINGGRFAGRSPGAGITGYGDDTYTTTGGGPEGSPAAELTDEQRATIEKISSGQQVSLKDQTFLSGLTSDQLKSIGVEQIFEEDENGRKSVKYQASVPNITDDQARESLRQSAGDVAKGTKDLSGRTMRMKQVYDSFRNAGFSDNQARALTAEVGRENSYQDKYLFGNHSDPHNAAQNTGFFSWQGARGTKLRQQLKAEGLIDENGNIIKGQEALDAMARFAKREMETDPTYKKTKELFLGDKNIDPEAAARILGKDYIRWRIDDPRYASHVGYRRDYLKQITDINQDFKGELPKDGKEYTQDEIDRRKTEMKQDAIRDRERKLTEFALTTEGKKKAKAETDKDSGVISDVDTVRERQGKQAKKRKLAIKPELKSAIAKSIMETLGPDYVADVYSGGQAAKGEKGPRTGTRRHDHGHAADLIITNKRTGEQITQEQYAMVGATHMARGRGSIGLQMSGGGIHMDSITKDQLRSGEALSWDYDGLGGVKLSRKAKQILEDGKRGIVPDGAMTPEEAEKILSKKETTVVQKEMGLKEASKGFGGLADLVTGKRRYKDKTKDDLVETVSRKETAPQRPDAETLRMERAAKIENKEAVKDVPPKKPTEPSTAPLTSYQGSHPDLEPSFKRAMQMNTNQPVKKTDSYAGVAVPV